MVLLSKLEDGSPILSMQDLQTYLRSCPSLVPNQGKINNIFTIKTDDNRVYRYSGVNYRYLTSNKVKLCYNFRRRPPRRLPIRILFVHASHLPERAIHFSNKVICFNLDGHRSPFTYSSLTIATSLLTLILFDQGLIPQRFLFQHVAFAGYAGRGFKATKLTTSGSNRYFWEGCSRWNSNQLELAHKLWFCEGYRHLYKTQRIKGNVSLHPPGVYSQEFCQKGKSVNNPAMISDRLYSIIEFKISAIHDQVGSSYLRRREQ